MKVYLVVLSSFFLLSHRCTAEGVDEADHSLRGTHQKKRTMNRQLVTLTDTILRLELIDSSKQTTVAVLTDGLSVPATSTLNVNAVVSNSVINDIKSVKFSLDTVANFRIENGAPFALCGEDKGVYRSCGHYLGVGTHTITAVPFGSTGGTGAMGAAKTLTFTIAAAATTTAAAIPSTPKPTTAPTTTAPIPSAPKPTAPSSAVPIPSPPTPTAPIPTALTTCKVPKVRIAGELVHLELKT